MAHQVVWEKLNVFVPGEEQPRILTRGQFLPEEAGFAQADRLALFGAVKVVDEQLSPLIGSSVAALNAPLAVGGEPLPATPVVETDVPGVGVVPTTVTAVPRPAQVAPKDAWVDYAVQQGTERGEAEGMSKADLVKKFGA